MTRTPIKLRDAFPGQIHDAPAPERRSSTLPEPVKVMFPLAANLEFRWRYADGSYSAWQAFPVDMQYAPPAARETGGIEWRPAMLRREKDEPMRAVVTPTRGEGAQPAAVTESNPD